VKIYLGFKRDREEFVSRLNAFHHAQNHRGIEYPRDTDQWDD
jgi:hypothetical protein